VTDGRMSGASGKVPAAIHVTPEAAMNGPIAFLRDGDIVRLDAECGELSVQVPEAEWAKRVKSKTPSSEGRSGGGHGLFDIFRTTVSGAEEGGTIFSFKT
jgi:phosphogluconate dehydratase